MLTYKADQTGVIFTKCVPKAVTLIPGCGTYSAANSGSVDTNALKCAVCETGYDKINFDTTGINKIPNGCVTSSFPSKDDKCILFTYAAKEAEIFCKTCNLDFKVLNFKNDQTNARFSKCVPQKVTLIPRCKTYFAENSGSVETNKLKCAECDAGKKLITSSSGN